MLKRWVLLMAQIHKNVVITGKYLDPAETICAHNILQPLPLFRTKMKKKCEQNKQPNSSSKRVAGWFIGIFILALIRAIFRFWQTCQKWQYQFHITFIIVLVMCPWTSLMFMFIAHGKGKGNQTIFSISGIKNCIEPVQSLPGPKYLHLLLNLLRKVLT